MLFLGIENADQMFWTTGTVAQRTGVFGYLWNLLTVCKNQL